MMLSTGFMSQKTLERKGCNYCVLFTLYGCFVDENG